MSSSTVTFYLNPDFWKDDLNIGTVVLYVNDENSVELDHVAENYLGTKTSALKLSEALPEDVHEQLQGLVKYSVFLDVGGGVEKLIGWFDRKPRCWTNGVWRKLRHGFVFEPYTDNPDHSAKKITDPYAQQWLKGRRQ